MTTFILTILLVMSLFSALYELLSKPTRMTLRKKKYNPDDVELTPFPEKDRDAQLLSDFLLMKTEYMQSEKWKSKRNYVLKRDNYTCKSCGITHTLLEVHHTRDYNLIPEESTDALVALCTTCHQFQHHNYSYPRSYQEYMTWNAPLLKRNQYA